MGLIQFIKGIIPYLNKNYLSFVAGFGSVVIVRRALAFAKESGNVKEIVKVELSDEARRLAFQKQELILKLVGTSIGAIVTLAITFFGLKHILKSIDPTKQDKNKSHITAKKLLTSIGIQDVEELSDYELCIASNLVDPSTLECDWSDIGGLQPITEEIKETIINPFKHKRLFTSSKLIQAPKGVLLHGPPGCGKTMIAKATAKASGARFINLNVSQLVDKWYGESQKRAEAVFSLAKKIQPTIIFIDEIDSFLRERSSSDHEATAMIKTQFMNFWDGLSTDHNSLVVVMGATNRPSDVDVAILRRMPSMFYIDFPNAKQRVEILKVILKDEKVSECLDLNKISEKCEGFSGSDLRELCRSAAVNKARDQIKGAINNGNSNDLTNLMELEEKDFMESIGKMKQYKEMTKVYETFPHPVL